MRIAQILYDRVHHIFEAESMPVWPPYQDGTIPVLVDITDRPEIQEGYSYDVNSGALAAPAREENPPAPEQQALEVLAAIDKLPEEAKTLVLDELKTME